MRKSRGFTAIEALVAAAILAVLTAAVAGALMAGRQQTQLARDTLSGSFLADALMDEVMRLPYSDPDGYTTMGPDPSETRSTFDNVDDYSGFTDGVGTTTTSIADLGGNAYADTYQGFVREVTMTAVSTTPTGWSRTLTGLQVTVTVTKNSVMVARVQRTAWSG